MAVRPGCVYTMGRERLKLPPGSYTIFAGHGFEYSVDSIHLTMAKSEQVQHTMRVTKQVANADCRAGFKKVISDVAKVRR